LLNCKEITAKLSEYPDSHVANPVAYELGHLDGLGPGTMNLFAPSNEAEANPDGSAINTTARFYDHLLECCENLFAGDLDQNTFEENLRFMFGTKAYLMFTVDKVIAALIKQVRSCGNDERPLSNMT
jgi:paired amphipathic helix protein Sin3a